MKEIKARKEFYDDIITIYKNSGSFILNSDYLYKLDLESLEILYSLPDLVFESENSLLVTVFNIYQNKIKCIITFNL